MNIDALTLKMFIATAETGSFTKAANKVFRTQSALSQRIAQLELSIGKQLIVRDKKLLLTNEGEIFLKYAKEMVRLEREMFEYFKAPEIAGEVKFGLPEDFVAVFMQNILQDFTEIHPFVAVNVECDLTLNLFERFKQGEFDLVLVKMKSLDDLKTHSFDIWTEKLVWVGPSNFFLSSDKAIPLVLSPKPCVYRSTTTKALDEQSLPWRIAFSSQSYAGKIAAIKSGLGITVLPKNMIPDELSIINSSLLPDLPDTHVSMLKRNQDHPAILSFERFVLERLRGQ
jgi:DNA-binding transcriptional LysR family regulator